MRMFSFSACWLCSEFAIGTEIVTVFSRSVMIESGKLPPEAGNSTILSGDVDCTALMMDFDIGKSMRLRALCVRRFAIGDEITLLANVFDESLHLALLIVSLHEAQIEHGGGGRWNYFRARAPTSPLAKPLMFSDGSLITSISVLPAFSVRLIPNCFFSSSSYCGASEIARRSASPRDSTSAYQPSIVTRPSSSFIEASRRASRLAGFGDQFP